MERIQGVRLDRELSAEMAKMLSPPETRQDAASRLDPVDACDVFRELLQGALAEGQAYPGDSTAGPRELDGAARIGWRSRTGIYLDPQRSFAVAQAQAARMDRVFDIDRLILQWRMAVDDLLVTKGAGNSPTTPREFGRVLHLPADWLVLGVERLSDVVGGG